MSEKIPSEDRKEFNEMMGKIFSTIVKEIFKPEEKEEVKILKENYTNSIQILSSIDPLTAYYLSGNANILEVFEEIEQSFTYVENEFPIEKNEIDDVRNKMINAIKPNVLNISLQNLENDIKLIAWKINPIVWFKSKKAIKYFKDEREKHIDAEIENIMSQIMNVIENEETTTANSGFAQ
jgi:hypothetical protein